jgi:hypothetical protein
MGAMIEQIWIGKTSEPLRVKKLVVQIWTRSADTISARGFWTCRNLRPDRSSHSIISFEGKMPLALRAATTEEVP